jgi:hypothetical protein
VRLSRFEVMADISSDEYILETYLPKPMEQYFLKKLPALDRAELLVQIVELIKGLTLMDANRGGVLFADCIDTIWHYWILQTEQYAQLCSALSHGRFRHHSSVDYPLPESENLDERRELNRRVAFFVSYVRAFGAMEAHRLRYWPSLELLMSTLHWDLPKMNTYLLAKAEPLVD